MANEVAFFCLTKRDIQMGYPGKKNPVLFIRYRNLLLEKCSLFCCNFLLLLLVFSLRFKFISVC